MAPAHGSTQFGYGDTEFKLKWRFQDADPKTGLNADFSKAVRGGPADHGFDEAFFTAACYYLSGDDNPNDYPTGNRALRGGTDSATIVSEDRDRS